jgi:hypothetical protein
MMGPIESSCPSCADKERKESWWNMRHKTIKRNREKGQSMVELALSFTVLLFLLMGVIDLGRAFFALSSMRDAAQEGAVFGSLVPVGSDGTINTGGIISRVTNSSTSPVDLNAEFASGNIRVVPSLVGAALCHGNGIRVDVYWDEFPLVFPLWEPLFGISSVPLHARVEDTILKPPCE